jgi:EAL domain-containing protein (putative c-di-GMP-specific phosphodiesterase class I)
VAGVAEDPRDRAIVAAVISMAHAVGSLVTAEGVETEAQLEILRELGCDRAQGYLLARPVPADELVALLS